ncbi:MAG: protein kinase [Alphaproteobacteria bacterium]|nr:protein kinase [Alphaproteobacteria bacterium]
MDLFPGSLVERYEVVSRLGSGHMATTYHVRHSVLDTHHALQVPNQHRRGLFKRLVAGARIQAKLRHPGVVSCTDVLDVEGSPVLVLDHVQGPNLDQLVRYQRLDERRIDAIAAGLFTAVDFIHANSIIHRHLKPKNVIVDLAHGREVPRITDFTLATQTGTMAMAKRTKPRVFGTASYMPPEQTYDSDLVGHQADVWAVACILYYLATGHEAFGGPDAEATFAQVRSGHYTLLKRVVPNAPDRWAKAIGFSLMVEPDDRIQSIAELAAVWFDGVDQRPLSAAASAPVGRVTLVFTDIQGSTQLWEADPEVARTSLAAHDAVMRKALHQHGGYEVKTEGDAFMVAFESPVSALRFCVQVQLELHRHPWSDRLLARPEAAEGAGYRGLRVRMGVHEGTPECRRHGGKADYYGPMVNRAARISGAGHGGQILVSGETWEKADRALRAAVKETSLGNFQLRGLSGAQDLVEIVPIELEERSFPPIKADPT